MESDSKSDNIILGPWSGSGKKPPKKTLSKTDKIQLDMLHIDELSEKQLEYAANDVIYLHKIKAQLEKMLVREKRMDLFKRCISFLDTRIELDQNGFKFDIFEH